MRLSHLFLVCSVLTVISCKPRSFNESQVRADSPSLDKDTSVLLDVNDVSFLFPVIHFSDKVIPPQYVKLTDKGQFDEILPDSIFKAVLANANQGSIKDSPELKTFANRDKWRIVAFRFDPCFPFLKNDPACKIQLRLVAQPFNNVFAEDMTMHLVYHPEIDTPDKGKLRVDIVNQLKNLKKLSGKKTNGLPLSVHPGFPVIAHGTNINTDFANAVKKFIIDNMGAKRLAAIAFMGISNNNPWAFSAVTVAGKNVTPVNVSHTSPESKFIGFPDTPRGTNLIFNPKPVHPDSLETFHRFEFNSDLAMKQKWFDRAARIENPDIHSPLSVDCVSCHQTKRVMSTVSKKPDDFDSNGELVPGKPLGLVSKDMYKIPFGVTAHSELGVEDRQEGFWVLRNFGHFSGRVSINGRTVTESAAVADWLNRKVLGHTDDTIKPLMKTPEQVSQSACFDAPKEMFTQVGVANFTLIAGGLLEKSKVQGDSFANLGRARLISPVSPRKPEFTHKFGVTFFAPEDVEPNADSNIGFRIVDEKAERLVGEQYNLKDFQGKEIIKTFDLKWVCDHYAGFVINVADKDEKTFLMMSIAN